MKRILTAMFNIFGLLTAPFWVIPIALWAMYIDDDLWEYLSGKWSIFS